MKWAKLLSKRVVLHSVILMAVIGLSATFLIGWIPEQTHCLPASSLFEDFDLAWTPFTGPLVVDAPICNGVPFPIWSAGSGSMARAGVDASFISFRNLGLDLLIWFSIALAGILLGQRVSINQRLMSHSRTE